MNPSPAPALAELPDGELAHRIANGDEGALRRLMRRHNQPLFRAARRRGDDGRGGRAGAVHSRGDGAHALLPRPRAAARIHVARGRPRARRGFFLRGRALRPDHRARAGPSCRNARYAHLEHQPHHRRNTMSFFAYASDGELRPARRAFLGNSGLLLTGTAVALLAGQEALAQTGGAATQDDVRILNTALGAELEAIAAYQVGAESGLLQKPGLD